MYNNENDVLSFIAHKSLYSCYGTLGLNAMYINNKYKLDIKGTSYNDCCNTIKEMMIILSISAKLTLLENVVPSRTDLSTLPI